AVRNLSATAGSGDWPLNGILKKLMPAAFAAAASASMLAPASVGSRRLMIDANPNFLSSGTASGVVAPPQATVVSSLAKLLAPGTVGRVTCAFAGAAHMKDRNPAVRMDDVSNFIVNSSGSAPERPS